MSEKCSNCGKGLEPSIITQVGAAVLNDMGIPADHPKVVDLVLLRLKRLNKKEEFYDEIQLRINRGLFND